MLYRDLETFSKGQPNTFLSFWFASLSTGTETFRLESELFQKISIGFVKSLEMIRR